MRDVVIIGSGVGASVRLLIAATGLALSVVDASERPGKLRALDSYTAHSLPEPATDDPFCGGGRSKGEKKRAARERRMKGGY